MKAIIACDNKGGMGYKNSLPWKKLENDLPRFKYWTQNQVIIMGRKTWESLPQKPLPNRLNIIVSTNNIIVPNGAIVVKNLDHFEHFTSGWIIGGANLINSAWKLITQIYLSRAIAEYKCDQFLNLTRMEKDFYKVFSEAHSDHIFEIWKKVVHKEPNI